MKKVLTTNNKPPTPVTEQDKQIQPMPGEVDPKDAKLKAFLEVNKAKNRFTLDKIKR